ncbi:MAG: RNA polymerase sigma factor [Saprospiraceae bacterium]
MFSNPFVLSDAKIMSGCQQNDRKAQELLYKRYFDKLLLYIKRYVKEEDIACSIINDTFLSVFKAAINSYQEQGNVEGWIKKIAYNKMSDHFRREKQTIKFLEVETGSNNIGSYVDEMELDFMLILSKIDVLPEKQRLIFNKYVFDGFSHKEIGIQMGISEGTSKWLLSEARKNLKQWLESLDKDLKYGQ